MASFGLDLSGLASTLITKTWHLQRVYNWQLLMLSNFGGAIGYLVSQFCQDVTLGDYRISELSVLKSGAFQRFYAGILSIDKVTLTFLMPSDNSVVDYFYDWSERVVDKNGFYYPKSNYKRSVFLVLYDQTKLESVRFELKGCFPISHPTFHPSYTDEGILTAQIELSVDKIALSSLVGDIRSVLTKAVIGILGKPATKIKEISGF